jgi:GT2 family glycosyltransferase
MLLRRAALDEVGLLDEQIFVYMDDVELCQRLRDAGWRVWYGPEVDAIHFGGHNRFTAEGVVSTVALGAFNRYFARRNGRRAAIGLGIVQTIGHSLRALLYGAAAAVRRGDPNLVAQARAHAAFCQFGLYSAIGHARKS